MVGLPLKAAIGHNPTALQHTFRVLIDFFNCLIYMC